jgi:hypothetical protein
MRILAALAIFIAALAAPGCRWLIIEQDNACTHHDGCGHYYWHDGWYSYPHPADCHRCTRHVEVHVHRDGCGHHYWHNAWYDYPHPHDCGACGPAVHVHGHGCGHHFWHGRWHEHPHPHGCGCH